MWLLQEAFRSEGESFVGQKQMYTTLLENKNTLSVTQINAQFKLGEF